jgi:hypothetical protein
MVHGERIYKWMYTSIFKPYLHAAIMTPSHMSKCHKKELPRIPPPITTHQLTSYLYRIRFRSCKIVNFGEFCVVSSWFSASIERIANWVKFRNVSRIPHEIMGRVYILAKCNKHVKQTLMAVNFLKVTDYIRECFLRLLAYRGKSAGTSGGGGGRSFRSSQRVERSPVYEAAEQLNS